MVFIVKTALFALLVVVDSSADVAAQTHRICSDGLCFETASVGDQISNITLGFAMPKEDCGEFLVNASIPLPYGFLSFTMGGNDYNSDPQEVALFIDLIVIPGPGFQPLNLSDARAQLSMQQ